MASLSGDIHDPEENLLAKLNDLDIGFVKVSNDGTIINHNLAFNKIFGYQPEKNLVNTKILNYWQNSEERKNFREDLYKKGFVKKYVTPAKKVDGEKCFLQMNIKLNKNSKREIISSERTFVDITERIKTEQKLKESEKNYQTIINNARDGILIIGLDGKFKFISPQLSNMLGGREINLKTNIFEFIHPDDKNHLIKLFSKGVREKFALSEEIEFRSQHKDGHYIWLSSSIKNYYDDDGNMIGFISLIREVTDKKIAEQELKESEKKYRELLENMMEGYYTLDLKGNFTFVNDYYCKTVEYSKKEIIGKNYRLIYDEKISKKLFKMFNQLFKSGMPLPHTNRAEGLTNRGKQLFLEGLIDLIYDSEGNKIGFYGFVRDITERKKVEDILYHERDLIQTLLENHPDFIYFKDKKARFQHISKRFSEFFGRSMEYIIGKSDLELFPEEIARQTHNDDLQVIKTGIALINKEENAAGTWVLTTKIPWFDKDGNTKGLFGISRDITELKKAQEKLKELSIMKSEFLRRASHELKTPLISIKGFSDLILTLYKEELNPDILSKLGEINQGCERLQNIINDLIHTSRLESSELKPKFEREDLTFLINYCAEELHAIAIKREHSINIELPNPLIARFEKEEIHDVITNLLTNAIKYTPPKGWIDIKAETLENFVVVSIKDNGIGFTEEEKVRIFQQFGKIERYGQGLDLGIDGSGLGLYISKKIVESHGGKIWMESEGKHKGSTFYFSLPK